ncbi:hypothetical protein L0244_15850 [bacterium]|nr:hypothetical protein [bacterium]MCI0614460.1 hypothetical protein [bacterium]
MKVKSQNPEVSNIVNPQDREGAAESEKVNRNADSLKGVGSLKSAFEMAPVQTALDKMIDGKNLDGQIGGKVRENLANSNQLDAKQKLSPDQFSINEKDQVVVQNQAETLVKQNQAETLVKQNQAETLNEKPVSETHIWMNAGAKKVFSKSPKAEAFVIDNRGVRKIINPEDVSGQIIDPQDLSSENQIVEPEDRTASKK